MTLKATYLRLKKEIYVLKQWQWKDDPSNLSTIDKDNHYIWVTTSLIGTPYQLKAFKTNKQPKFADEKSCGASKIWKINLRNPGTRSLKQFSSVLRLLPFSNVSLFPVYVSLWNVSSLFVLFPSTWTSFFVLFHFMPPSFHFSTLFFQFMILKSM